MEDSIKPLNSFQFRGKRGERNLLIISLYEVDYGDFLSRIALQNMDGIARQEGYDGWIRTSLCPFIDSRKLDGTQMLYPTFTYARIMMIRQLLESPGVNIKDVWLTWGDGVEHPHCSYLKQAVGCLYGSLLKFDLRYWCIWRTRRANPRDCSPETLKGILPEIESPGFIKFDLQHYVHHRNLDLQSRIFIK